MPTISQNGVVELRRRELYESLATAGAVDGPRRPIRRGVSSRTPGGRPVRCGVCGKTSWISLSPDVGDAVCPSCGSGNLHLIEAIERGWTTPAEEVAEHFFRAWFEGRREPS